MNVTEIKREYDYKYSRGTFPQFRINDSALIQVLISRYNLKGTQGLDLGCGTGSWTNLFNFNDCDVQCLGLDLSEKGIKRGKTTYNHEFIIGDAFNLPFKYQSFDFIFCRGLSVFSVQNLSQMVGFGQELMKYLKAKGIIIIIWSSNLSNLRRSSGWFNHTLHNFNDYLYTIGCEDVEVYFSYRLFSYILKNRILNRTLTSIFSRFNFGINGYIIAIGECG